MEARHVAVIAGIFILVGFSLGFFLDPYNLCTQKACSCLPEEPAGEYPCNGCSHWDPIFVTFVADYGKRCSATDMLACPEDTYRYVVNETSCEHAVEFFSSRNYLW